MRSVLLRRASEAAIATALLVGACGSSPDARRPANVVATVSEQIATVVTVRWTTSVPTTGYVEFGPTRQLGVRTPVETTPAQDHTALLLGLTADAPAYFRAVSAENGAAVAGGDVDTIRTGNLPVGLPQPTVSGTGFDGFVVVPILGVTTAVTILDAQGNVVWYHGDDRKLDFYRARLSVDGKSLLYNAAKISGEPLATSELVRVSLDGAQSTSIPIPFLAHDFVEHPDGTLAAIAFEDRQDADGNRVRGNKLVEVAPDGTQSTVWTSWNCFDPVAVPGDDPQQGWTFANALDYDAATDAYYVGMRNFSSIAKVNRTTGACEWVLGLYGSTFTFASGAGRFLHEHQFDVRGDHILVMDNDGAPGDVSRVLEYQLDFATMTATQVWSYTATPSVYTFVLGEPIRLADGGTFVNWSTAGQMERLDAGGNSVWKLNTDAGFAFGFQTLTTSLYGGGIAP
jgi:hypothetical protein